MPFSVRHLVIRADADHAIGIGHAMRCLAVAQVLRARGGGVTVAGRLEPGVADRYRAEGCRVELFPEGLSPQADLACLTTLARAAGPETAILVDGYGFDAAYLEALSTSGLVTALFDDYNHLAHYDVDTLINPNPDAQTIPYSTAPRTRRLLGTAYTPLRREFSEATYVAPLRQTPPLARRLLVTAGGSDPEGLTLAVARALSQSSIQSWEVRLVLGPAYHSRDQLDAILAHAPFAVTILHDVTAMAPLLAWADMAITAGGSTCHELACLGVPFLVCPVAANQQGLAAGYARGGAARLLDPAVADFGETLARSVAALAGEPAARQAMAEAGRCLMDSFGAMRIVESLDSTVETHLRGDTHV